MTLSRTCIEDQAKGSKTDVWDRRGGDRELLTLLEANHSYCLHILSDYRKQPCSNSLYLGWPLPMAGLPRNTRDSV